MGIPLLTGREFTRADNETAPPVAIVDETMAAQFWRDADPVGQRVQVQGQWMQVVGVARTAKYRNLLEAPKPFFYVPLRQNFSAVAALQIRTSQARRRSRRRWCARSMRSTRTSPPASSSRCASRSTARRRRSGSRSRSSASSAGSHWCSPRSASTASWPRRWPQSTRELALRMALGAGASDLLQLAMSKGLALTIGGVALGAAAALEMTRLLGYLLYQVSPRDSRAFGSAFAVLALASLTACVVPALRAVRTDPIHALR